MRYVIVHIHYDVLIHIWVVVMTWMVQSCWIDTRHDVVLAWVEVEVQRRDFDPMNCIVDQMMIHSYHYCYCFSSSSF